MNFALMRFVADYLSDHAGRADTGAGALAARLSQFAAGLSAPDRALRG